MKCVILAGGYGTRLAEETKIKPKPLVKIGNKQVQGKSLMEAVKLMRGPVGTSIELTVRRKGVKKPLDFKIISQMITSFIDSKIKLPQYDLHEAWGVRTSLFENTKKHDHKGMELSGILYLNDSNQHTYFPELDLKIKPKKGKLVLFDPTLKHYSKPGLEQEFKYAIAFNYIGRKPW